MDNVFINLGDMVSVGQDSVSVFDSNNILSTSDTLVGPQGPPGPPGRDGRDGVDGQAATVQVGSTTTTEPGTNAVVTNSGDTHNCVLNFSIPRGATGETGPAGQDGVNGEDGFSPEAYVTQNPAGATITITDASGTTAADVYNGPAGPAGPAGADGFSPIATVTQNTGSATISITDSQGTTTATVYDGSSASMTILSYGHSTWNDFITAYNNNAIVYARASSNNDPGSGSQTRLAFMAYVNNASTPTSVEFQYYRSIATHSDSQQGDQVYVYKLTNSDGGTWSVEIRSAFTKIAAGTNMTSSYSSGTLTLNATQPTVPTKTSDLTNDGEDGTSTYVEADQLAAVATSGSYNDLTNTPTIPAAQVNSDWNAASGVAEILNKPTLATVATSGSYNDLTDQPTIPTGTWSNSGYFDIGDIRVCWGYGTTGSSQTPVGVVFPAAFSVAPRVTATANFYEAGGATWSVFVSSITTTGFNIQGGYNTFTGGGGYYATGFDYIAIGKK